MWTKDYWKATAERMLRGFAIGCLLIIGGDTLNVLDVNWLDTLGFGVGGAVLALLMSIAGNSVSGNGPSFTQAEAVQPIEEPPPDRPRSMVISNTPLADEARDHYKPQRAATDENGEPLYY